MDPDMAGQPVSTPGGRIYGVPSDSVLVNSRAISPLAQRSSGSRAAMRYARSSNCSRCSGKPGKGFPDFLEVNKLPPPLEDWTTST